jgi:transcriptional regulator with XRE-family HTH domain
MDNRTEVREFLTTRRAKIMPDQAGVAQHGRRRRVPGLRREEVAQLAGVSTDYYTRLERGNLSGASDSVLDSIAAALHLDDAERVHLFNLARTAHAGSRTPPRAAPHHMRASVKYIIDSMTNTVAFVRNARLDILKANLLGRALWCEAFEDLRRPPNLARYAFLDPRAPGFYPNWTEAAAGAVALLRSEAGRTPHDRSLTDLVGELATRSEPFRAMWATHDVKTHNSGVKHFHHPIVGDLTLTYDALDLPASPGLSITAYTAEPGSEAAVKLTLLATWAATTIDQHRQPTGAERLNVRLDGSQS